MKFSERQGIVPVRTALQTDEMAAELRNSLWNALHVFVWKQHEFMHGYHEPGIYRFSRALWLHYFKLPLDEVPPYSEKQMQAIRKHFFGAAWYQVYEFIEFTVQYFPSNQKLVNAINSVLERELGGYRLIGGQFAPVTDKAEIEALESALADEQFPGVRAHLKTALDRLSDKKNPDYRNTIKEAISAVESMARVITGDDKAVLSDALKVLEKQKKLHPALKDGFVKLYGYTSDEQGVRHAMMDEPNITAADAKYILLACTSFVNYLKSLLAK